ncbi:MAG: HAD hydrolase-like protein [Myxococcota bacterium]
MNKTNEVRPAIFFDLDGTLTDPKRGITGCIQYALERMDAHVPTRDELTWCIGPPLQASFAELVGDAKAEEGVRLYRERYTDLGIFENEPYAGIPETLHALKDSGAALFVASSKPHVFVHRILVHFELDTVFEGVFGSELDGTRTDKVELLQYALDQSGVNAAEAVMIGDRKFDALGAQANEMEFLGVLYGYGSLEELRSVGVTKWVESPDEIKAALSPSA